MLILIIGLGFRYFFIVLLLNEFQKHLRGHNVVGNNEALNVLLRAPDIEELVSRATLKYQSKIQC